MGLDKELFESEVKDEFICKLCRKVFLNPVVANCGHTICHTCYSQRLVSKTSNPTCPTCGARLHEEYTQASVEFKLELLNLKVKCSNKCGESFPLSELPDHSECCPFAPVLCENKEHGCKKKVRRCDLKKHLEECDFRIVECEACGLKTKYLDLFTHQSRVRCLEKKLKQQIIREKRNASLQTQRHREKLFREGVRLEQQQRQRLLAHSKVINQTPRKNVVHLRSMNANTFLTQSVQLGQSGSEDEFSVPESPRVNRSVGRTPHSSRSGFILQPCRQCDKLFRHDTNYKSSCRWHIGPLVQVFGGTCFSCGRLDYQPGCVTGFHKA